MSVVEEFWFTYINDEVLFDFYVNCLIEQFADQDEGDLFARVKKSVWEAVENNSKNCLPTSFPKTRHQTDSPESSAQNQDSLMHDVQMTNIDRNHR